jgi:hypothetical protein
MRSSFLARNVKRLDLKIYTGQMMVQKLGKLLPELLNHHLRNASEMVE